MRPMFEARFQSFDDSHEGTAAPARLERLRAELKRRGLDGIVVPRADRQQNEYLPASEERLAWLTGFTGSAGAAVVLAGRAAVFVDGRYTVQAAAQIDAKLFAIEHLVNGPPEQWLEQNLKSGAKLGYDPWLHTTESAEKLRKVCATVGAELVAVDGNPIDALWSDRPAPPAGPVTLRDIKFAGESAADKLKRIRAELHKLFDSPDVQARMRDPKRALLNIELNPTELVSIIDAAKNTPYSSGYLSQLARYGLIDAVKIGRNWLTTRAIVVAYVERQKKSPPTSAPLPAPSTTR